MVSAATGVAVAATFVWLGMVLAISFLEAPLKFRAPDVTLRIGPSLAERVDPNSDCLDQMAVSRQGRDTLGDLTRCVRATYPPTAGVRHQSLGSHAHS